MLELAMFHAVKCPPRPVAAASRSLDAEIREFLAGKNDGENLLHAIYDDVMDEPVPECLLAVLRD